MHTPQCRDQALPAAVNLCRASSSMRAAESKCCIASHFALCCASALSYVHRLFTSHCRSKIDYTLFGSHQADAERALSGVVIETDRGSVITFTIEDHDKVMTVDEVGKISPATFQRLYSVGRDTELSCSLPVSPPCLPNLWVSSTLATRLSDTAIAATHACTMSKLTASLSRMF